MSVCFNLSISAYGDLRVVVQIPSHESTKLCFETVRCYVSVVHGDSFR